MTNFNCGIHCIRSILKFKIGKTQIQFKPCTRICLFFISFLYKIRVSNVFVLLRRISAALKLNFLITLSKSFTVRIYSRIHELLSF